MAMGTHDPQESIGAIMTIDQTTDKSFSREVSTSCSDRTLTGEENTKYKDSQQISSIPDEAKSIEHGFKSILFAIVRLVLGLGFIAFGFVTYCIDGKATTGGFIYEKAKEATNVMPTIYPIVFAVLMSTASRDIAVALAIRGTKLRTIEKLLQFNSVAGVILKTALKYKMPDLFAVGLLFLWLLSPLGGQGALRMLEIHNSTRSFDDTFSYYVLPNATSIIRPVSAKQFVTLNNGTREVQAVYEDGRQVDAIFTSSLFASARPDARTQTLRRDHLGNFRLPRLSSLESSKADKDGWIRVAESNQTLLRYSSFVGIPAVTNSTNKRSTFNIVSSYLEISCGNKTRKNVLKSEFPPRYLPITNKDIGSATPWVKPHWLFNITTPSKHQPPSGFNLSTVLEQGGRRFQRSEPRELRIRSLKKKLNYHEAVEAEGNTSSDLEAEGLWEYELTATEFACSVIEVEVEAMIACTPEPDPDVFTSRIGFVAENGQCEVTAMRAIQTLPGLDSQPNNPHSTFLDEVVPVNSYTISTDVAAAAPIPDSNRWMLLGDLLFDSFSSAGRSAYRDTTQSFDDRPLLVELYLNDPTNMSGWNKGTVGLKNSSPSGSRLTRDNMDLFAVSTTDFSDRLTILINSFYQTLQVPYLRTKGIPSNWTEIRNIYDEDIRTAGLGPGDKYPREGRLKGAQVVMVEELLNENLGVSKNTVREIQEVFLVRRSYWVLYILSSFTLFLFCFASFVCFFHYNGRIEFPEDVMEYFGSFTRESPFIQPDLKEGGSSGSGSADLKNVRVRLGDVQADKKFGRIALFREDTATHEELFTRSKEIYSGRKFI